jgi:GTPase SAR1 family protein
VGKTCLFKRYTAGQAIASFEPTIGVEIATKMLNIHGNTVKSLIWVPLISNPHHGRLTRLSTALM